VPKNIFEQKLRSVEDMITDYLYDELFFREFSISISALCKVWIILDP
jgi:hypothetical protein